VTHIVRPAIGDIGSLKGLLPGFFDVDPTKGCFAGKD